MNENALGIEEKVYLKNPNKDVKKRVLKIVREELDYLLEIEEDGIIVHEIRTKDIDSMKQQFEGIAEEVNLYWQDKTGAMNIRLNSKEAQTEIIQLVNYASYPKDVVFKTTLEAIKKQEELPKKIVDEKTATEILLSRMKKFVIGATALGIGCVLYAFHIDSDVDTLNEITRIESDFQKEDEDVELVPEESKVVMNPISNSDFSMEKEDLEENSKVDSKSNMLYLYNQPLLPTDLNIYMYQMAEKYNIPYISLMSIAHVESDGKFDNHAKVGCSGDEGIMQINPANYPALFEALGYTPDQIKNDDKVNIECAAYILEDICTRNVRRNGIVNMDEVYREYNGGGNFENVPATLDYLSKINSSIEQYYNSDHLISVEVPSLGVSK